jgi:hypothetical protein
MGQGYIHYRPQFGTADEGRDRHVHRQDLDQWHRKERNRRQQRCTEGPGRDPREELNEPRYGCDNQGRHQAQQEQGAELRLTHRRHSVFRSQAQRHPSRACVLARRVDGLVGHVPTTRNAYSSWAVGGWK